MIISLFLLLALALGIIFYSVRGATHLVQWGVLGLFVLCVGLAYWHWEQASRVLHAYAQQKKLEKAQAVFASLKSKPQWVIQKLEEELRKEPKRPQGWYLLGRLYASQGEWQKAHQAYARAYALAPEDAKYAIYYAEGLWEENHKQLNDEARALLSHVLQKDPKQKDALSMLAMDAYLRHAYQQAIDYWELLLSTIPTESKEALLIQKAIVKASKALEQEQGEASHEREGLSSN